MSKEKREKTYYVFKVIVIGETGVGKTSLVKRFVSNLFAKDYKASIGTNIYNKKIKLNDNEIYLNLYDIAGQEQWANMRHKYYKGSHAAFVVGDVSREITFEKIKTFWIQDLKEFCPKIPLILIANKDDLNLNVDKKEIERIRNYINAAYLLFTSAKTGNNVNKAFQLISELIMKKN